MAQRPRTELGTILKDLLGSNNVYFQPKENIKLSYPAIIYSYETTDIEHANNNLYLKNNRYLVTYIDRSPDSNIPGLILELPTTTQKVRFEQQGLYHYNFTTYF